MIDWPSEKREQRKSDLTAATRLFAATLAEALTWDAATRDRVATIADAWMYALYDVYVGETLTPQAGLALANAAIQAEHEINQTQTDAIASQGDGLETLERAELALEQRVKRLEAEIGRVWEMLTLIRAQIVALRPDEREAGS